MLGGGIPVAVLRSSWFAQNFSEHFLLDAVLEGVVALPTPASGVAEPFVDIDDVADLVAALLCARAVRGDLRADRARALTFADAAAVIAGATGRQSPSCRARRRPSSREPGRRASRPRRWNRSGDLFAEVLDGRNEHRTDDVRRVLDRAPRPFADVVRDAAAAGAWDVPASAVTA